MRLRGIPRGRRAWAAAALACVALALGACSGQSDQNPGFVHIDEGATATAVALAEAARPTITPTPGPSATPFPAPTPHAIPTDPPGYDGAAAITRVGRENITLDEYRQRVRFERYVPLFKLVKTVEESGAQVLDLTNPDNAYVGSLFATLADSYSFGKQVQRILVIEHIAQQEALRRSLEVDPAQFDAKLAEYLGLPAGSQTEQPAEFQARYAEFLAGIKTYAGMTEEQFRRLVRAQTLYAQLEFLISHEEGAVPAAQPTGANDVLTPAQLQELRERHFLDWVESRMDNPAHVEDFGNWLDQTPQEPLPRDVSPWLQEDANITLPEGASSPNQALPTPTPTPAAP